MLYFCTLVKLINKGENAHRFALSEELLEREKDREKEREREREREREIEHQIINKN